MKQRRHTPEQVIRKLAEGEKLLGEGKSIEEVSRHLEDLRADLAPVAQPVRRDEGRRRQDGSRNLRKRTSASRSWWPIRPSTSRHAQGVG